VKLSAVIPVYNEANTITEIVEQVFDVTLDHTLGGIEKEIVIVNDGSTDETESVLSTLEARWPDRLKVVHHEVNQGKGAAIRTALEHVTGDLVITQDADLEYHPQDYPALLAPFKDPAVQVVYGSRNLHKNPRSTWSFYWGGRLVSWVANFLYGSHLTDEATGYKVFRTDLLRGLGLQSARFEFCPEVTGKILRRGVEIHEVPISYQPRSFAEGKKISWHDGIDAIWTLLKCRFASSRGRGERR
jgi:glycosyltransferase involved in cell wall biosynthesis